MDRHEKFRASPKYKAWLEATRERRLEKQRQYNAAHREQRSESSRKRHAVLKSTPEGLALLKSWNDKARKKYRAKPGVHESELEYSRIYEANRPPRDSAENRAYHKTYYGTNVSVFRAQNLKRLYGITLQDYDNMLASQGGGCAICGSKSPGKRFRHFHVDHSHATGKIRGLLCAACNAGIGHLKDSLDLLERAMRYLDAHENPGTVASYIARQKAATTSAVQ